MRILTGPLGFMAKRKPYEERNDRERIESQWRKLSGLLAREEWSAAVVRVATAAEISANLVIRKEFSTRSQFDAAFVDGLLKWSNGLSGKFDHLLLPLFVGRQEHTSLRKLKGVAEKINRLRNDVVHSGIFCNDKEAQESVTQAKNLVETLLRLYEPEFTLKVKKN
jgi:hypothetical protein